MIFLKKEDGYLILDSLNVSQVIPRDNGSNILKFYNGQEVYFKESSLALSIGHIFSAKILKSIGVKVAEVDIAKYNNHEGLISTSYNPDHLKEKKISDTTISNVNDYLQLEYNYQHQIIILEKEKMIIEQVKKNISDDIVLKRVINDIVKKNHNYANLLDELTLSEYGGTLEMLNIQNFPAFQVNLSVNEILHIIDKSFVNEIINNNQSLSKRLQLFLNHTIFNDIPYKHNIGIINKQYTNIQDIISYLLIPTSLSNNTDIFEVTKNYENLLRDVKDIYRVNSFFIISSRTYDSDQYIVNYKRGE